MANWNLDFPDDFLGELLNTDSEALCENMINEALPVVKTSMERVFASHVNTGALAKSVKISKAKAAKNGGVIGNVNPKGKGSDGVPNALKAIWLENGRVNQPAQPWLSKVVAESEASALKIMQDVYDKKVGNA